MASEYGYETVPVTLTSNLSGKICNGRFVIAMPPPTPTFLTLLTMACKPFLETSILVPYFWQSNTIRFIGDWLAIITHAAYQVEMCMLQGRQQYEKLH